MLICKVVSVESLTFNISGVLGFLQALLNLKDLRLGLTRLIDQVGFVALKRIHPDKTFVKNQARQRKENAKYEHTKRPLQKGMHPISN